MTSTAADGKTELVSVPGHPLLVSAVEFNRVVAERDRLLAQQVIPGKGALGAMRLALEVLLDTLPNPGDHCFGPSLGALMGRRQRAISGLRAAIRGTSTVTTVDHPLPPPYSNIYPADPNEMCHFICYTPAFQPGGGRPQHQPVFTADQMRQYARTVLTAHLNLPAAEVTEVTAVKGEGKQTTTVNLCQEVKVGELFSCTDDPFNSVTAPGCYTGVGVQSAHDKENSHDQGANPQAKVEGI